MNEEYKKRMAIAETATEKFFNEIEKSKSCAKLGDKDENDKIEKLYLNALNSADYDSEEEKDWYYNYTQYLVYKCIVGIKFDDNFVRLKGKSVSARQMKPIYKAVTEILDDAIEDEKNRDKAYYIHLKEDAINSINEALLGIQGITVQKDGCYIATSVYGSYDCEEVWTLRRFRDNYLSKTTIGNALISTYYAISPTLVKWFGNRKWFNIFWRWSLDKVVKDLNTKGYDNSPYKD